LLLKRGWKVGNVDATIIAQMPKMAPHILAMREHIAADLAVDLDAVNVKATTTEQLGFTGRGEGIAAEAVCGGADHAELAARLRGVSGLPAVLEAVGRAEAPVRYRRLIAALAGLAGRAVGRRGIPVAEFLAGDAVVLARMLAATDAMAGAARG
jgi:hypothetical protein